uniref:Uncharacterized protein n=1 Tax=Arundo donax TaxID=35708 RepID=A0A0A9GAT6_ARUDO
MRSYILWMEKRKCRKVEKSAARAPSNVKNIIAHEASLKNGSFVVAPVNWNQKCSNICFCSWVRV